MNTIFTIKTLENKSKQIEANNDTDVEYEEKRGIILKDKKKIELNTINLIEQAAIILLINLTKKSHTHTHIQSANTFHFKVHPSMKINQQTKRLRFFIN